MLIIGWLALALAVAGFLVAVAVENSGYHLRYYSSESRPREESTPVFADGQSLARLEHNASDRAAA